MTDMPETLFVEVDPTGQKPMTAYANSASWPGGKRVQYTRTDTITETAKALIAAEKVADALAWYISEDDTYTGGEWEEKNAYWIEGKRAAKEALAVYRKATGKDDG